MSGGCDGDDFVEIWIDEIEVKFKENLNGNFRGIHIVLFDLLTSEIVFS